MHKYQWLHCHFTVAASAIIMFYNYKGHYETTLKVGQIHHPFPGPRPPKNRPRTYLGNP